MSFKRSGKLPRYRDLTARTRRAGGVAILPVAVLVAILVVSTTASSQQSGERRDEVLWNSIRTTDYVEMFEFFLAEFPSSPHAPHARTMIAVLRGDIPSSLPKEPTIQEQAAIDAAQDLARAALDPRTLDVAAFQRGLRERGCNAGPADGIWGDLTVGAAQRFVDARGLDIDPSRPGVALFSAVMEADGNVCGEI